MVQCVTPDALTLVTTNTKQHGVTPQKELNIWKLQLVFCLITCVSLLHYMLFLIPEVQLHNEGSDFAASLQCGST